MPHAVTLVNADFEQPQPAGTTQVNIMVYSTAGAVMTDYVDEAALSYRD